MSHPEFVEWKGLQVLNCCISAGATLGKPLCIVLTVLHLHNTHQEGQWNKSACKWILQGPVIRLHAHDIFSDESMCFIWAVPGAQHCPVFRDITSQLQGLWRVRHCHTNTHFDFYWNLLLEIKTQPNGHIGETFANVDLHPSGVRNASTSLGLYCLLRHWIWTFTWYVVSGINTVRVALPLLLFVSITVHCWMPTCLDNTLCHSHSKKPFIVWKL